MTIFVLISGCLSTLELKEGDNCTTPNGEVASCASLLSCKVILDAISTVQERFVIDFARASQCGFEGLPLVCCGKKAYFDTPENLNTALNQLKENDTDEDLWSSTETYEDVLPSKETCGLHNSSVEGENSRQYPWMAAIVYKNPNTSELELKCVGSFIHPSFVLTAANCTPLDDR